MSVAGEDMLTNLSPTLPTRERGNYLSLTILTREINPIPIFPTRESGFLIDNLGAAIGEVQFAVFEIAFGEHGGVEGNLSVMDGDTEFEEAIEDIFFHLSGHTGLLYARHGRCMRIGVEGEGAVFGRLLVAAQSFADGGVVRA